LVYALSLAGMSQVARWAANGLPKWNGWITGGTLMGIGGVLGMGCTIGQGITGMSTLALGSLLVLISIIFGSALTMKIQYYKMMYDEEATFMASLLSSLCDMKLLPESTRKLEAP
jgi:uncharacterized membrane protein YedE/YeeE